MGQNTKPAKNKAKPRKAQGVYAAAAQTRQDRLNKALGDTGSGRVERKKFAGKTQGQTKSQGQQKPKPKKQGDKKK